MTTKWGSTCKLYFRKRSRNSQGKYISKQQQQRQGKRVIQINRRWSGQEANDQKQGYSPGSKHGKQGRQENRRLNIQSPAKTESVCVLLFKSF